MKPILSLLTALISLSCYSQLQEVIPTEYDALEMFDGDYAIAKKNGSWGIIDKMNQIVIPFEYDSVQIIAPSVFALKQGDSLQLADPTGKVYPEKYDYVGYGDPDQSAFIVKRGDHFGVIDYDLEELVPTTYTGILDFQREKDLILATESGLFGVQSPKGKEILPQSFEYIIRLPHHYLAGEFSAFHLYDKKGRKMSNEIYSILANGDDHYLILMDSLNQQKVLNTDLELVHDKFKHYEQVSGNIFVVQTHEAESGIYDIVAETWIVESDFVSITIGNENRIVINQVLGRGSRVVNLKGEEIFTYEENADYFFDPGRIKVRPLVGQEEEGIYMEQTRKLWMFKCHYIQDADKYFVVAFRDGTYDIYNYDGNSILQGVKGDVVMRLIHDNYVLVQNDADKYGISRIVE